MNEEPKKFYHALKDKQMVVFNGFNFIAFFFPVFWLIRYLRFKYFIIYLLYTGIAGYFLPKYSHPFEYYLIFFPVTLPIRIYLGFIAKNEKEKYCFKRGYDLVDNFTNKNIILKSVYENKRNKTVKPKKPMFSIENIDLSKANELLDNKKITINEHAYILENLNRKVS